MHFWFQGVGTVLWEGYSPCRQVRTTLELPLRSFYCSMTPCSLLFFFPPSILTRALHVSSSLFWAWSHPAKPTLCAKELPHLRNTLKNSPICGWLNSTSHRRWESAVRWSHDHLCGHIFSPSTASFQEAAMSYFPFFTAFFLAFYHCGITSVDALPKCCLYLEKEPTAWC